MNIEEKRRSAFEAAFVKQCGFGRLTASANADAHAMYYSALWAWNAALESVVIELPNIETDHPIEIEAQADMRSRCREAIESAGLKVKP